MQCGISWNVFAIICCFSVWFGQYKNSDSKAEIAANILFVIHNVQTSAVANTKKSCNFRNWSCVARCTQSKQYNSQLDEIFTQRVSLTPVALFESDKHGFKNDVTDSNDTELIINDNVQIDFSIDENDTSMTSATESQNAFEVLTHSEWQCAKLQCRNRFAVHTDKSIAKEAASKSK